MTVILIIVLTRPSVGVSYSGSLFLSLAVEGVSEQSRAQGAGDLRVENRVGRQSDCFNTHPPFDAPGAPDVLPDSSGMKNSGSTPIRSINPATR
jgi:hypothetical protein